MVDRKEDVPCRVFDPNPAVNYSEMNSGALPVPDPVVIPDVDPCRVSRTLKDIWVDSSDICKIGGTPPSNDMLPYIRMQVCNQGFADEQTPPARDWTNNVFDYGKDSAELDSVMVYFHADRLLRYLDIDLGLGDAFTKPVLGYAHLTVNDPGYKDYSYYNRPTKSIHFPAAPFGVPGAYNAAKDADCILHECGHHIFENSTAPNTLECKGIAEGFCDTVAGVFFAPEHELYNPWRFEDWLGGYPQCLGARDLNSQVDYPGISGMTNEYDVSKILSGALWELYERIGGKEVDPLARKTARASLLTLAIRSITGLAGSTNPAIQSPIGLSCTIPEFMKRMMAIDAELKDRDVTDVDGQPLMLKFCGKRLVDMMDVCRNPDPVLFNRKIIDPVPGSDLNILPGTGPMYVNGSIWITDLANVQTDTLEYTPGLQKSYRFHAVISNQGAVASGPFLVVFNISQWAGMEFQYPEHYVRDSLGKPSYVSAAYVEGLDPGQNVEVTADLPGNVVPDPAVTTDFCYLASIYSPIDITPTGTTRFGSCNNIAQRNMMIKYVPAPSPAPAPVPMPQPLPKPEPMNVPLPEVYVNVQINHEFHQAEAVRRIVVKRPPGWEDVRVAFVGEKKDEVIRMFRSIEKPIKMARKLPDGGLLDAAKPGMAVALENLERLAPRFTVKGRKARLFTEADGRKSIVFSKGRQAGLPYIVQPNKPVKARLKVTLPRRARPGDVIILDLFQENKDGNMTGGIQVKIVVTENILAGKE